MKNLGSALKLLRLRQYTLRNLGSTLKVLLNTSAAQKMYQKQLLLKRIFRYLEKLRLGLVKSSQTGHTGKTSALQNKCVKNCQNSQNSQNNQNSQTGQTGHTGQTSALQN